MFRKQPLLNGINMATVDSNKTLNDIKWSRRSETYDNSLYNYFRYLQKRILSKTDLRENDDFLDLGCGTGWAVRYAHLLLKGKGTFTGIDISSGMIQKATENSLGLQNIHFIKASVDEIPLCSASIDTIICTNSFHHYLEPLKVLSEVFRLLKPNGKMFLLDLTADNFMTKCFNAFLKRIEPEHIDFYSTKKIQQMFTDAKLHYLKSETIVFSMKVHIAQKLT
jgi:ubiquinone/menaquinone biosynthesis C-methylase UbiE